MRTLFNNTILLLLALTTISWAGNSQATVVGCDSCTPMQMRSAAEDRAMRLAQGRHTVKVLNLMDADYHAYQIDVIHHSSGAGRRTDDEVQLQTSRLTVHNESVIRQNLRDVRASFADIRHIINAKVILPESSPYTKCG